MKFTQNLCVTQRSPVLGGEKKSKSYKLIYPIPTI